MNLQEESLADFNDANRTTEQIDQDNYVRCQEWADELNEAAGHHIWVECEQSAGSASSYATVTLGFESRKIGDPKVAAAIRAAADAFHAAMNAEHAALPRR